MSNASPRHRPARPVSRKLLARKIFFFAAIHFLFSAALPARQFYSNQNACPCPLRGTILDSVTNRPIRNALVQLVADPAAAVLSNTEGSFQFDSLPLGPTILQASKPGYLSNSPARYDPSQRRFVNVAPDVPPVVIKLVPESVIYGQLADENGEPLEGFSIGVYARIPGTHEIVTGNISAQVITDDEGKFRIAGLHSGSYYLTARPEIKSASPVSVNGYPPQSYPPTIYPGANDISSATLLHVKPGTQTLANFSIKPATSVHISGTVAGILSSEQPQLSLTTALGELLLPRTKYDPISHTFQMEDVAPGTYVLTGVAKSGNSLSALIGSQTVNATSGLSAVHLVLAPTADIPVYFQWSSPTRDPLERVQTPAIRLARQDLYLAGGVTNDRPMAKAVGTSTLIAAVAPGTYSLFIENSGDYFVESATMGSANLLQNNLVVGASSSNPPIQISMVEGAATLSGSVHSGGQYTAAAIFLFSGRKKMPEVQLASEEGKFAFRGLSPDRYRIIAVDDVTNFDFENPATFGHFSSKMRELTLSATQSATISLELTTVNE